MRVAKLNKVWILFASSVLIFITAGIFFLNYKTDQMMTQASEAVIQVLEPHVVELPENGNTPELSELPTIPQTDSEGTNAQTASDSQKDVSSIQVNPSAPAKKPAAASTTANNKDKGSTSGDNSASKPAAELVIEEVTLFEKAQAYKLASSKLSTKEISALMQWRQGGFTESERESAKSLFYSRFTEEEQQWILGLFKKYN